MGQTNVKFAGGLAADTSDGPSAIIWGDQTDFRMNPEDGFEYFWDGTVRDVIAPTLTTEVAIGGGLKVFASTPGTFIATGTGAGASSTGLTADNDALGVQTVCAPFKIIRGGGKVRFECSVKASTIADSKAGIFAGLCELLTLSAILPIIDAGTLADQNFVGLHRLEADGDQFDTVYKADGVTQVTAQADAAQSTIAADAFTKLGFVYDPRTFKIAWYIDGMKCATEATVPAAASGGTGPFPNDVMLAPTIAFKTASADDFNCSIGFIRCSQERVA